MEMVKMINGITGTEMLVARDRVMEYRMAGHKLAGSIFKHSDPVETTKKESEPEEAPAAEPEKIPEESVKEKLTASRKTLAKAPAKRKK